MATAHVALGGNLGNVAETFRSVLTTIDQNDWLHSVSVSPVYQTASMGGEGPAYLNAVAILSCELQPASLLLLLQEIEVQLGRTRETRWGSRTLDLDLLAVDGDVCQSPELTLPHPGCWWRRFVLDPWKDIAPDWVHPVLRESVEQLHARLLRRPLQVKALFPQVSTGDEQGWVTDLQAAFSPDDIQIVSCTRPTEPPQSERGGSSTKDRELAGVRAVAADFQFVLDEQLSGDRTIVLPGLVAGLDLARSVLNAALDEPLPCGTLR